MNVFTTDHPFNSQQEGKMPGLRSYLLGMCVAALILYPLFAIGFWFADVTDNGESTGGYTPAPFWADCLAAAVVSLLVAFIGASVLMLFALLCRKFSKSLTYAA